MLGATAVWSVAQQPSCHREARKNKQQLGHISPEIFLIFFLLNAFLFKASCKQILLAHFRAGQDVTGLIRVLRFGYVLGNTVAPHHLTEHKVVFTLKVLWDLIPVMDESTFD